MGNYLEYYKKFDSTQVKKMDHMEDNECYIHISILKNTLEGLVNEGYEILGWEAIILTEKGTLSPVELVIGTGPEKSKEIRNKNALTRDYSYFVDKVIKRVLDNEYNLNDIYIDLVIK